MSEEMKMADVFALPVNTRMGGVMMEVNGAYGGLLFVADKHNSKAAAHAINNHDRLTEQNAKLAKALKALVNEHDKAMSYSHGQERCIIDEVLSNARAALANHKEPE